MFRTCLAAQHLRAGCAAAQVMAPAAAFRPSRTLRLYTNGLAGMEPRRPAPLRDRCGSMDDLNVGTEGKDAHHLLIEGDKPGRSVSVAHTDAVANQATAALRSLLECSRPSSSAVSADGEGETQLTDAGAPAAHTRVHGADEVRRGVGEPRDHSELPAAGSGDAVEGSGVSNGEEELLESAEAFADDTEAEEKEWAAAAAKADSQPHWTAAQKPEGAGEQQPAHPGATPHGAGEPVNLYGARYWGSMADSLQSAAEARGFISPFWSPRAAFEKIGATVTAKEEDATVVQTCTPGVVRLFNLEQTTLAAEHRASTVMEVLAHLRVLRYYPASCHRKSVFIDMQPLDLAGNGFSHGRGSAITHSRHFLRFQRESPYWISDREVRAIGAVVRPEEVELYALAPTRLHLPFHQNTARADAGAGLSDDGGAGAATVSVSGGAASPSPGPLMERFYSVAQLDDPQRFAELNPVRDRLARCFNSRGSRYKCCTTWLMWEYCARYHFPLAGTPCIVFLTMEKIHQLGGSVMPIKRHPISRKHAGGVADTAAAAGSSSSSTWPPLSTTPSSFEEISVARACGGADTGTCSGHNARGGADGTSATAPDAGVLPPPFTMEVQGDVVSLFNVMQTNIADLVLARVGDMRTMELSKWRSRYYCV
ncbi:hypothetical protein LSCM1_05702 [Leishmania martiniquensis]|uniref:Trypanosoma Tc-38 (p38) protein domain-containing protein n=1 Tax=Leishmania martiniquensis TaxID=1580590 RepID=A0A836GZH1_9TRYP|nr:hypothetical protein LSCM1_05702 [Leishmania martiniquensis]